MTLDILIAVIFIILMAIGFIVVMMDRHTFVFAKQVDRSKRYIKPPIEKRAKR